MPPSLTICAINFTATLAAAALLGCSGGGGDSTAPPSGSLVISLGAPALSIAAGSTGTVTASVTRAGGFSDAVTVSVTGLPAGVTVSSNTQTTVGTITTATITLTVVSSASAGTSTATVSASGAGVTTVSASFTLTLTSAASNQVSLNFAQCGVGAKPLFVAFQDGATGAWTRVTGTNDVYSFSITQAKGGYAYVTPTLGGTAHLTTAFLGTRAEVGAGGAPINICGAPVPPQRTITGTVTGMTPGQAANVYLGGRPGIASPAFPNFTISSGAGWAARSRGHPKLDNGQRSGSRNHPAESSADAQHQCGHARHEWRRVVRSGDSEPDDRRYAERRHQLREHRLSERIHL